MTERVRQTADERRATVLEAAIAEFAARGYHGTPTEAIAKRAEISHAYLFRLYGTKKELFLACVDRCFDRTIDVFRAAADDDEIRARARERYEELRSALTELGGMTRDEALRFMGQGMLLNVITSLQLEPEDWVYLRPDGE